MEDLLLKKEEADAQEFTKHIQRLTGKQFMSLMEDFYSGKTFFKKRENSTILEYIRYCSYNYAINATFGTIAEAMANYPNIKKAILDEGKKHAFRGEHMEYLNVSNVFEGIRIIDSYSTMNLPFDKTRLTTHVLYYDDLIFGYHYIPYDEYNAIMPDKVLYCFGEEYKSHDGSFRGALLPENRFEIIFMMEDTKPLAAAIAEVLSTCGSHISRKIYGYDNIDDVNHVHDVGVPESYKKCFYAHWIISNHNQHDGLSFNVVPHKFSDAGAYASLVEKFGNDNIRLFVTRLHYMIPAYHSTELFSLFGLNSKIAKMSRQYGQKIVALYGKEKDMVGDLSCRQWLEIKICDMVGEFLLNNISFNFSVVHDWAIIKDVDDMVASNTFYKDSKYKHNQAIIMLCRKYGNPTLTYVSRLYESEAFVEGYGITPQWKGMPAFAHIMFSMMYGILCLNEKLGVIHGDLHSDNVIFDARAGPIHTSVYLVGAAKGGSESLYVFADAFMIPILIDFGRSFLYEMPNADRMLIYYKTMFPEFYKKNQKVLENNIEDNKGPSYKAFSAIDIYIICDSIISGKLFDGEHMELVLRIQAISQTYLFDHMLNGTATQFCAREVMGLFSDHIAGAGAKLDASLVSSYSILSSERKYSINGILPPMCTPNMIRHNGEQLEMGIGTGFSYRKRHRMRVKKGLEIYEALTS